jgi:hypothetical protein
MEAISDPKPKATKVLLPQRRWTDYSDEGSEGAGFHVIADDLSQLPAPIAAALLIRRRQVGGLDPNEVNWNVALMMADGGAVIDSRFLEGGAKLNKGCCGEDALWLTEQPGNVKGKPPMNKGNLFFDHAQAIYIIDAGLCPCRRCCGSLLGLARELKSCIVVRPLTDYEFINSSKTTLKLDPDPDKQIFLLLFTPDDAKFTVFYEKDNRPRQLESTVKPVNTNVTHSFACDKAPHFAVVSYGTNAYKPEVRFKCMAQHCKGTLNGRELKVAETSKAKKFNFADMTAV